MCDTNILSFSLIGIGTDEPVNSARRRGSKERNELEVSMVLLAVENVCDGNISKAHSASRRK